MASKINWKKRRHRAWRAAVLKTKSFNTRQPHTLQKPARRSKKNNFQFETLSDFCRLQSHQMPSSRDVIATRQLREQSPERHSFDTRSLAPATASSASNAASAASTSVSAAFSWKVQSFRSVITFHSCTELKSSQFYPFFILSNSWRLIKISRCSSRNSDQPHHINRPNTAIFHSII